MCLYYYAVFTKLKEERFMCRRRPLFRLSVGDVVSSRVSFVGIFLQFIVGVLYRNCRAIRFARNLSCRIVRVHAVWDLL